MISFFVCTPFGESEHDSIEEANTQAARERLRVGSATVDVRDAEPEEPNERAHEFAAAFAPFDLCDLCARPYRNPIHHPLFRS